MFQETDEKKVSYRSKASAANQNPARRGGALIDAMTLGSGSGNGARGRPRGRDVATPRWPRRRRTTGTDWLTDSFAFFRYGDVSSFTAVLPCRRAVPCQLAD